MKLEIKTTQHILDSSLEGVQECDISAWYDDNWNKEWVSKDSLKKLLLNAIRHNECMSDSDHKYGVLQAQKGMLNELGGEK